MKLIIDSNSPLSNIQQQFSGIYPFLKIEFFKNTSEPKDRYTASQLISSSEKVSEAWGAKKVNGSIDINDLKTVYELENDFLDQFGLFAQVFRKSGNVWLESTTTDNLTLKQQNDHGREISTPQGTPERETDDYDLTRDSDH